MSKTEQIVFEIANKIAEPMGYEIVETEYKKEGSDYFLRVYIDKEDGYIGIDDCEKISRLLSDELDKKDPISEAYFLEVCSPGIDRKLKREKDFIRFTGREVDVKLYAPIDGMKELCGVLKSYSENKAEIQTQNKTYSIDVNDAVYIKLAVKF